MGRGSGKILMWFLYRGNLLVLIEYYGVTNQEKDEKFSKFLLKEKQVNKIYVLSKGEVIVYA